MARQELLDASDAAIDDAANYLDPIVLRGLLYQLTGDESVAAIPHAMVPMGFRGELPGIVDPVHVAYLRARAAAFLKSYRDAGAGDWPLSAERHHRSMELAVGGTIPGEDLELWTEQMALDPAARCFDWKRQPDEARKSGFMVAVVGAGMGGLNAAVQLKRAGIPFVVIEKNRGVGGTWHENRYPGARVDTPSRAYAHIFAVGYPCLNPFAPQAVNEDYFNWIADHFDLRDHLEFNTEVTAMTWDEDAKHWTVDAIGPDGPKQWQVQAVISCVGCFNRPHVPDFPGADSFTGLSIHTARWQDDLDLTGKRVAVIGSGATSYQTVPELAKQARHLTLFQRTPSWCIDIPGYLKPFPPQVSWLDRNLPWLVNFARLQTSWLANPESFQRIIEIDPNFDDPHTRSPFVRAMREQCLGFTRRKLASRPDLIEQMTPVGPPLASRPVVVDPDDAIYDALLRDNVALVSEPIAAITPTGVKTADGHEHEVDVIVYATGFKAHQFLWPMDVRGRDGQSIEALWARDGARAYIGSMLPGFPNFFMVFGPNITPFFSGLGMIEMEELATRFAMKCIEALILDDRRAIDVKPEAYDKFNAELDRREKTKAYLDHRVQNAFKNEFGRSAINCPFDIRLLWNWWRDPTGEERPAEADPLIRPYLGEDLLVD